MSRIAGIILAAGKGKRFKLKNINKVVLPIAGRPMITYAVELLKRLNIKLIIIVVGFAGESVKEVLRQEAVIFAQQKKYLGTAHALSCGLEKIPKDIKHVVVLNGDDALFLTSEIVNSLIAIHIEENASLTLLTIELLDPIGIGRVIRDAKGNVASIVEEKDATPRQRTIKEVNGLGYVFTVRFLKKYLKPIRRSKVTGEYYLTSLIEVAVKNKEKVADFSAGKIPWRGINTKEDLEEAERLLLG